MSSEKEKLLSGLVEDAGVDALLLYCGDASHFSNANIMYATGVPFLSHTYVIATRERAMAVCSGFEYDRAKRHSEIPVAELGENGDYASMKDALKDLLGGYTGFKKIGIVGGSTFSSDYHEMKKALRFARFRDVTKYVDHRRMIKTRSEIDDMKQAAGFAEKGFYAFKEGLGHTGETEKEVAVRAECAMRKAGAIGYSFPTIIKSGPESATDIHGEPSDKKVEGGFAIVDYGPVGCRHHTADVTRTYLITDTGEIPQKMIEMYNTVLRAQEAAIKAAKPGATMGDVKKAAKDVVDEVGYGDYWVHGIGHGLGYEVHDPTPDVLEAGMVITIEPGIYVPNVGGVRIEDDVYITAGGNEVLTAGIPKRLEDVIIDRSPPEFCIYIG